MMVSGEWSVVRVGGQGRWSGSLFRVWWSVVGGRWSVVSGRCADPDVHNHANEVRGSVLDGQW